MREGVAACERSTGIGGSFPRKTDHEGSLWNAVHALGERRRIRLAEVVRCGWKCLLCPGTMHSRVERVNGMERAGACDLDLGVFRIGVDWWIEQRIDITRKVVVSCWGQKGKKGCLI